MRLLWAFLTFSTASWAVDWALESNAPWQARDSQVEFVLNDRLWIGGGWFQSYEAPPRDLWSSADGQVWKLSVPQVPWKHSDLAMSRVFQNKVWVMGGWFNGRLPGHSASNEVWSSADAVSWSQVTSAADWSPRLAAGLVEHRGHLWILGGTENYYFGDSSSVKNDVWSSSDGRIWTQATEEAAWSPRAYHQAVVLNNRMYVLGGGNYVPAYEAKNDVWSSSDGVKWTCELEKAPWSPRLWFSAAVYRGRMWVIGGWSKENDNFGDVWHSANGRDWQCLQTKNCWKARHEHSVLVYQDKLWVLGGHARPLSSEVWSLYLPANWKP